jgi:actin related protein 2/3 complex subunit 1A/1B
MPDAHSFGVEPVSCHAWNKDRTQVALSLNSSEVQIHTLSAGKWTLTDTLTDHSQRVTGLDWGAKTNQLVTCAADCNAYVWKKEGGKWTPALVVLRISRGATCVQWSPLEDKFAVGSGARCIAVCYYDKENDWWISKQIKKPIKSTVTCVDWHPNNMLIACGSSDFKSRVYSAYIKEVDDKPPATNWGSKLVYATLLQEFASLAGGWVHGIKFSPSGDKLVWVGHDSTLYIADAAQNMKVTTVKTEFLPFLAVLWTSESNIVVAGFDCSPMQFSYSGQGITFTARLDDASKQQADKKFSAKDHFKTLDSKAATTDSMDTILSSLHQNSITSLVAHTSTKDKVNKFSSSATDGQLILWDLK